MMELHTVRAIPWDVGGLLSAQDCQRIARAVEGMEDWRVMTNSDRAVPSGCFLFAESRDENCELSLSIFDDGIAVFEFVEAPTSYDDIRDFDPATITDGKRVNHIAILRQCHVHSDYLQRTMAHVRKAVRFSRIRASAGPNWENAGLSYVFSYFILGFSSEEVAARVQDRVTRLLYPLHTQTMDDKSQRATVDLTWPLDRSLSGPPELIKTVEVRPNLKVQASWTTMCVFGYITNGDHIYYRNVQISIQHCWFFCYVMANHIEEQFRSLKVGVSPRKVARIDQDISELRMQLTDVRYVRSSMARLSEFSLFELLVESSRLEVLIRRVDDVTSIFQERYSNLLNERRIRSAKVIEWMLFLFAAVSAVGAYFSILSYRQVQQAPAFDPSPANQATVSDLKARQ